FANIDAIVAFERIVPIGSQAQGDWLARLSYSGGIGTERRIDVPSWWTVSGYAEGGHYISHASNYATASLEAGRTYRIDRISPRVTVFPFAVAGADYDTTVDRSVPIGAGVGVSARYAFRDGKYDALRSSIELSIQYRWKITGDDRARGVFCGAVLSY
ncbi:MAG TPA: bacteriophage N4 adsorption protein A, partial [Trinickia sp.]|nr:bacteriophage N4 adsorption protein A [Trinickia sp.]